MFYYQNALQTPTPNAEFTRRLYSVHAARRQRTHGTLEDTTALPQHAVLHVVETPSRVLKLHAAAWRSRRFHSVSTALVAFAQRTTRRSAIFLNAVGTL